MTDLCRRERRTGSRVLPPQDAARLCGDWDRSDTALLDTHAHRAQTLRELRATVERAEREGYASGMARALQDMAGVRQDQFKNLQKIENGLTEILLAALKKLLGEMPPEDLVVSRLRAAIKELGGTQAPLTLEVHADMLDVVSQRIDEWRRGGELCMPVVVREADHCELLDCRLDLGEGTIDAGLLTQLEALEQCFAQIGSEE